MKCRKQSDILLEGRAHRREAAALGQAGVADGDERLNWPSVTLHIPTSELGVMGEK